MKYYCEDSQQVLQELNSQKSGLTEKEAAERLLQNGANELKAAKGKSLLRRFAEQVADPMIVILLAAAAISGVLAVLENDSFADVIIILAVVLINAVLGVYQESKAEKAIEALQDMAAATSKVVRDGKMSSILSKDLVVRTDCLFFPDAFIDLINRKNTPLIAHQKQQNIVFNRCQLDWLSVHRNLFGLVVDHESASAEHCIIVRV